MNREVSDVDAEFAALIGERVSRYQARAAWHAQRAREYLDVHLITGLTYCAAMARSHQADAYLAAHQGRYWLDILTRKDY